MADAQVLLALDQGTTSSRALLLGRDGRVLAEGRRDAPCLFPKPGWVEADPRALWESQLAAARAALASWGGDPASIAAIGITNQRETVLLWERRSGAPIGPAIVWQDRRTAARTEALRAAGHESWIAERTGLLCDPYFSASKVEWLLDEIPGARARAEAGELAMGTVDSWLLWNLTGGTVHATDPSNASRTQLWNLATQAWDPQLLELFRIPESLLPEVRPSSGEFGRTRAELLGASIPIAGVIGDQQAALAGQGCFTAGEGKVTYGTGCFLLVNTGERPVRSAARLLTTAAWRIGAAPTAFALEGSVFMGGATVQWLRDGLGVVAEASEIGGLAASVPDSGGVVLVPAFTGLGAPHWDPQARGAVLGLTRGATKAHLARAALEGIALQVAEIVEAATRDLGRPMPCLRVDGGAAACDLLLQIQADLLGIPVERPAILETTAVGAATMAGLAVGVWEDPASVPAAAAATRFEPRIAEAARQRTMARWREAVECVRRFGAGDAEGARS